MHPWHPPPPGYGLGILLSTLTTKGKGKCKGASKLFPDLKNYTALGPRPPDLKFLDPPLERG